MRRQFPRVAVDLYVNKLVNGVPFLARTRDLSREGVFLHKLLEPSTPMDAHIAVEFSLPGHDEVIWAEAEVVREAGGGNGLRFRELTPRQSRLIEDFVSRAVS